MIKIVGESDKNIGSEIHIYLYKLSDNSEVMVGGFVGSGLFYVKQKMPDGTSINITE